MLEHLAAIAQELGITRFTAEVLPQNRKMLTVFKEAGYEVSHHIEDGVVEVSFDILPTEQSKEVQLSREHRAEARSMRTILFPQRVAIIGASRREESIGALVLANILAAGFQGELYPIHREAEQHPGPQGLPDASATCPSPSTSPSSWSRPPRPSTSSRTAARPESRRLLVLSAGFAEAGEEGVQLQEKLRRRVRRAGMRVVGPNSFGLINNDPDGAAQRDARLGHPRVAVASGSSPRAAPSVSRCSRPRRVAGSASPSSPPRATGSTSRATTSCSTGSTTRTPTPSGSTSSRWATRASSRASPGSSRRSSRSSSSARACRASPRRPVTARASPTCRRRPSTRCCARPASSGSRTSTSSSTSPS